MNKPGVSRIVSTLMLVQILLILPGVVFGFVPPLTGEPGLAVAERRHGNVQNTRKHKFVSDRYATIPLRVEYIQKKSKRKGVILTGSNSKEEQEKTRIESLKSSYGEKSRKNRRTIYNHDLWVKHRSSDRIFKNLSTTLNSSVLRQLGTEVAFVIVIASIVAVWNSVFVIGYQDLEGFYEEPLLLELFDIESPKRFLLVLPGFLFTLSMPALSLLLGEYLFD